MDSDNTNTASYPTQTQVLCFANKAAKEIAF
jgi:hypothetical protein